MKKLDDELKMELRRFFNRELRGNALDKELCIKVDTMLFMDEEVELSRIFTMKLNETIIF